jgi:hypothetical protein
VNRPQNWKSWDRRGVKLDYQCHSQDFHSLIINPFDNQTVTLLWVSRISDTLETRLKGLILIIKSLSHHINLDMYFWWIHTYLVMGSETCDSYYESTRVEPIGIFYYYGDYFAYFRIITEIHILVSGYYGYLSVGPCIQTSLFFELCPPARASPHPLI